MLKEAKQECRVEPDETAFDTEIAGLIEAAALYMSTRGIILKGVIRIEIDAEGRAVDKSTVRDPLIKRTILCYCKANFGSHPHREELMKSFEMLVCTLKSTTGYTNWGGECCDD